MYARTRSDGGRSPRRGIVLGLSNRPWRVLAGSPSPCGLARRLRPSADDCLPERATGPHPIRGRPCRPPTPQARHPLRRPRIRLRQVPEADCRSRHQAPHRTSWRSPRIRPRPDRYVVERTFAWLHAFRRLATCYERRADLHDALLSLGCSIICWRRLTDSRSF
jgi:transposase